MSEEHYIMLKDLGIFAASPEGIGTPKAIRNGGVQMPVLPVTVGSL